MLLALVSVVPGSVQCHTQSQKAKVVFTQSKESLSRLVRLEFVAVLEKGLTSYISIHTYSWEGHVHFMCIYSVPSVLVITYWAVTNQLFFSIAKYMHRYQSLTVPNNLFMQHIPWCHVHAFVGLHIFHPARSQTSCLQSGQSSDWQQKSYFSVQNRVYKYSHSDSSFTLHS